MLYTEYTYRFLTEESSKGNKILVFGLGELPSPILQKIESNKSITISNYKIQNFKFDPSTDPKFDIVFLSRVVEHFTLDTFYVNFYKLSKIAKKVVFIVPDMEKVVKSYLEKVTKEKCLSFHMIRDLYEIYGELDPESPEEDKHYIFTSLDLFLNNNIAKLMFPFHKIHSKIVTSNIEINGYPHIQVEMESKDYIEHDANYYNGLFHLPYLCNTIKKYSVSSLFLKDSTNSKFFHNTYTDQEIIRIFERTEEEFSHSIFYHIISSMNIKDVDYFLFKLSCVKTGTLNFVEYDKLDYLQKLISLLKNPESKSKNKKDKQNIDPVNIVKNYWNLCSKVFVRTPGHCDQYLLKILLTQEKLYKIQNISKENGLISIEVE